MVLLGQGSGKEVSVRNPGVIELSFDWIMAIVSNAKLEAIIPCEVQSIDITGNYRANWDAYSKELEEIPNSKHGMNWANVWKRLIPQLILKGSISTTSKLCRKGIYFVVPDRVYLQFEKLLGPIDPAPHPAEGVMTVMTYSLGPNAESGEHRPLLFSRSMRMHIRDFAKAFGSGDQLPAGTQLDAKVLQILNNL